MTKLKARANMVCTHHQHLIQQSSREAMYSVPDRSRDCYCGYGHKYYKSSTKPPFSVEEDIRMLFKLAFVNKTNLHTERHFEFLVIKRAYRFFVRLGKQTSFL